MATKGRPFTVRLSPDVERRLEEEAGMAGRPKTVMLETLADEGLKMRRFPGIGFAGPEQDRRAYVIGTGLDVWEIVELYRDHGEDEGSVLGAHPVTERQLSTALAYHREHPEEVARHIRDNDRTVEEWQRLYPSLVPPRGEHIAG